MTWGLAVFDLVLVVSVLGLAWRALADPDPLRAVVQFIAMGTLLAVAWVRLRGLDVALAEAAVGAALTGALLLGALAQMREPRRGSERREER